MKTCFLHIDYDEADPGRYRAVVVRNQYGEEMRYNSGDVVTDWKHANEYVNSILYDIDKVFLSSSCDHFVFDNSGYSWDKKGNIVRV